ncbi:mandelate racemase/muconate lactonizing enzyme family protein [Dactylosporangium salmoneum]|uniref:mandelate racemase/muconate lactonizing enzyme family protein n=1 Tax=Dactylosporangium salmoneum TaxID=53361 RepID=UPI0031DCF8FB
MKRVDRLYLNVPFRPRLRPWHTRLIWGWQVVELIRIETTDGTAGWGERLPHYTWGETSDAALDWTLGRPVGELLGDDRLGPALQMAAYDAAGKALGVPAHRLFGRPMVREEVGLAWWATDLPPEVLAEEARDAAAAGYRVLKTKPRPWFDVWRQLELVGAATPEDFTVGLDWNGTLRDAGTAKPVLLDLERFAKVAVFETPIPHEDVRGYRELRSVLGRPLYMHLVDDPGLDETVDACDGYVIHDGIVSVLTKGLRAAAFNKPFWLQVVGLGLTTALCAQLAAVLTHARRPHVSCLNIWENDLLADPLRVAHGNLAVPAGPGLGVEIDEASVHRYAVAGPTPPERPGELLTVRWPTGRSIDFTSYAACNDAFLMGNEAPQERGVTLDVTPDDGSSQWRSRFATARARDHRLFGTC